MAALTLQPVPRVTYISLLLIISLHHQEKGYDKKKNGHQRENALIFYQILSTNSLWKCMEISLEK